MKVAVYSDLHEEFNGYFDHPIPEEVDVVVLAGDIVVGFNEEFFWKLCGENRDKGFLYILGNHDCYRGDITDLIGQYTQLSKEIPNFYFLHNSSIEINGIVFHGTPLWTDFSSKGDVWTSIAMLEAGRGISDFYKMVKDGVPVTPQIMAEMHREAKQWLIESLTSTADKTNVVITHFPPVLDCKHPKIAPNILDAYFNNDLLDYLSEVSVDTCVYGHNHWSDRFYVQGIQFFSNQLGYPREGTNFNDNEVFEVFSK